MIQNSFPVCQTVMDLRADILQPPVLNTMLSVSIESLEF